MQEGWTKEFFGSGILVENNEQKDGNFLKKCVARATEAASTLATPPARALRASPRCLGAPL